MSYPYQKCGRNNCTNPKILAPVPKLHNQVLSPRSLTNVLLQVTLKNMWDQTTLIPQAS